jgi:hypothetical protein
MLEGPLQGMRVECVWRDLPGPYNSRRNEGSIAVFPQKLEPINLDQGSYVVSDFHESDKSPLHLLGQYFIAERLVRCRGFGSSLES